MVALLSGEICHNSSFALLDHTPGLWPVAAVFLPSAYFWRPGDSTFPKKRFFVDREQS